MHTKLDPNIAILMYRNGKISQDQARKMAGMSPGQFQNFVASRELPVSYDTASSNSATQDLASAENK
ncbi:MAG: hypothetical protein F6K39_48410 [Okeania sp. SIO3B3]|nr:hypothetical protein [Okeania sp. SIO3B3]